MKLNQSAAELCDALIARAQMLRIECHAIAGATVIDLGVEARGGLEAGLMLARICVAGLAQVKLVPCGSEIAGPAVTVHSDQPVAACLASQYAGWRISAGKYFAMGSGPMRAAHGQEKLFDTIGHRERPERVVGVLETSRLPPAEVVERLAGDCGVPPEQLTLLVAPTASQAGTVQIVARSVETALHKLHELQFDLARIESGWGVAPLPPPADDDLVGIGRTNDAILYGASVVLWVRGDDASLQTIGPRVPSSASPDHGEPFAQIFQRYDHDFYKIDPSLFSPAVVTLTNLDTGNSFRFGRLLPEVVDRSFGVLSGR